MIIKRSRAIFKASSKAVSGVGVYSNNEKENQHQAHRALVPRRGGGAHADSDQHPLDNISINVSPPQPSQYRKFVNRK